MTNTIGHVLNGKQRELQAHFEDLHPSLDKIWFGSILERKTLLDSTDLLAAFRTAYTRCKESFDPNARVKAIAPTVLATKHVHNAIADLTAAKEYGL